MSGGTGCGSFRTRVAAPQRAVVGRGSRGRARLDASKRDWQRFDNRLFSRFSDNDLLDVIFGEARQSDARAETAS
jgi:hypothetical protein